SDPAKVWRFVRKLHDLHNDPKGPEKRAPKAADAVLKSYTSLATMAKGNLGKNLAAKLQSIHKAEAARPAVDLKKQLAVRPTGAGRKSYGGAAKKKSVKRTVELRAAALPLRLKAIGKLSKEGAAKIAAVKPTRVSVLSKLDEAKRATAIGDALEHFTETIRLLKARADFLRLVAQTDRSTDTPSGFGRLDAFGAARNRFFP